MENSKIEWCHHTFNPWRGCAKVSAGCKSCYAEALLSKRYKVVEWGVNGTRLRTSADNWRKPFAWDKAAKEKGIRYRVFCASLADVFEDHPAIHPNWRYDLFGMIERTQNLDWLLLTKRPENVMSMLGARISAQTWLEANSHVWIGTSVEDQEQADKRIPILMGIPARVRFLSMEPLLESVDVSHYVVPQFAADDPRHYPWRDGVDWVIVGGESGHNCRPMQAKWAEEISEACYGTGTAFFMKQLGGNPNKRDRIEEFPNRLQIREFPGTNQYGN